MRKAAKALAMNVKPIRELIESRATLLAERDDADNRSRMYIEERDLAIIKRDVATRERDLAIETCERTKVERDKALQEIVEVRKVAQNAFDRLHDFGERPFVPNGHFYSPIPLLSEFEKHKERIYGDVGRTLPGVDLNESGQIDLLELFRVAYKDLPFPDEQTAGFRYHYKNPAYGHSDAIFLNMMIRHAKPRRVIEIGSGYSSCMLLDTNERWFDNSIDCTFIEPYPQLLHSLLKKGDAERVKIIPTGVQDVGIELFQTLEANDILFVDSTHVSKVGSDVNEIVFKVLPALASGVFVHFHDIFYPMEYPADWIEEGRAWNEAYLLRAFLQHNSVFEVVMFNTFMQQFHRVFFEEHMPLCLKNTGASIWLRKR